MYFTFTQAADADLTTKGKRLVAWHLSATAAAVCNLRDGSVSGPIVVQILCPINDMRTQTYTLPAGLVFPAGVFVDVVSGTFVGSVDII
jgi:hypothetical protein